MKFLNFKKSHRDAVPAKRKQGGFTIVELLITLGIIGVAVIGIVSMSSNGSQTSKVQAEVKNLQALNSAIRSGFGQNGNAYTGLTETLVKNSGGFPTQMVSGGTPINTWGGAVKVLPSTLTAGVGFDIEYSAVPQGACVNLVNQVLTNYQKIKINATTNAVAAWSATAVDTACVATNTITFNGV